MLLLHYGDLGNWVAIQLAFCFESLFIKGDFLVELREIEMALARMLLVIDLESDAEGELLIGRRAERGVAKFDAEGCECKWLKLRLCWHI